MKMSIPLEVKNPGSYRMVLDKDVEVPMRDGAQLRERVRRCSHVPPGRPVYSG